MTDFITTAPARHATRLAFFAAGFAMACCAPLFPFIKSNAGADEKQFGILLLCLGIGSIVAMPITGIVTARRGSRPMILMGGFGLALFLPLLAIATSPVALGTSLFMFGASLGSIDVAMNVHDSNIEGSEQRPLMSNFHAQFSVGGFFGAGLVTLILSFEFSAAFAAMAGMAVILCAILLAQPHFLTDSGQEPEPFVFPKGIVLLLATLVAILFLVEGAVLDWGALLIIDLKLLTPQNAGVGYILFSIAMVAARLSGGRIIASIGEYKALFFGGITAILGIAMILVSPQTEIALSGFVLIGLGAANIVPIVFSAAGRQKIMPAGLAVASVTTTGYAGVLIGPALVGLIADATSLTVAFWLLALLTLVVPLTAHVVVRTGS